MRTLNELISSLPLEEQNKIFNRIQELTELERLRKLVWVYEEYVELLTKAEGDLIPLAFSHGYRCPQEDVEKGARLRADIESLKRHPDET